MLAIMVEDVLVGRSFLIGRILVIKYYIYFCAFHLKSIFKHMFVSVEIQVHGAKYGTD